MRCYRCSRHILGKRLAYSIMVNLDNSFNVWNKVETFFLWYCIYVFHYIYNQRCELFLFIYTLGQVQSLPL